MLVYRSMQFEDFMKYGQNGLLFLIMCWSYIHVFDKIYMGKSFIVQQMSSNMEINEW